MNKKNCYRDDFQAIASGRTFCFCVLLVALLAFGFSTFNMAVSSDDLQGYIYTGSGRNMLASGRFTIYLIDRLTSTTIRGPAVAYTNDILAILGLIWAAINFCIFFRRVCGEFISNTACTVFTCIFISYPLVTELWEYIGAYRNVAFGFLCDSFALILMYDVIHEKAPGNWKKILAACILMMLVCAGYESLVPVYIFCVFAILALQVPFGSEKEKKLSEIIRQGLCYAGVLIIGLILRVVVHKLILHMLNLVPLANGETGIFWGTDTFGTILARVFRDVLEQYILRSIIFFPLTELMVAAVILLVIGIVFAVQYRWTILVPGLGMYLSLISLSLLQGNITGYRTCQVFAIFVAFVALFVVMLVEKANKSWLRITVLFLLGYLCFHQADQTNYFLTMNYIRSEEELAVVRDIGSDLAEGYDKDKPVIFVGSYSLRNELIQTVSVSEDSLRWIVFENVYSAADKIMSSMHLNLHEPHHTLVQTNVRSVISFGRWAFGGTQEAMWRLFSFAGYDYVLPDCYNLQPEADAYVEEHEIPAYPKDGYIQDVGDYIIVHIQ